MEVVNELCDLLQVHVNRDKVACLACYALKLWGSTTQSKELMTASAKIAGARSVTRLFDDANAIKNLINYGLGRKEGVLWGSMGVCNGLSIVAYLQFEKLMFLVDTGILPVSKEVEFNVKTGHKVAWSLLAFFGLIRSLRALHHTAQNLKNPNHTKCAPARFTQAALTSTKFFLDVIHAVSWLPPGWLWGGAISTQKASAVATASAVVALVMHYHGKRLT
ncbi:peroxisomal biogenesis factor 11 (PEX11) domain-containing protein [Phthorimaea operculella]|nr:peroxisomal biogenesis factor 11 (PEX11) domain-containing protein [Phthorimaea operculella]